LFAPILCSHHWWLYVLDVTNRKFYVLDSKNSEPRHGDRNKLNRFAFNVLDQMRVRAGAKTMFPRMTRNMKKEQKEAWKARKEENRTIRQKQSYSVKLRELTPRHHYPRLGVAEPHESSGLIQHPMPRHG
ncbi:hypothetical protein PIB30_107132, partial [Stylosanthes scabra]|nr:hypothetical protein [Stylosanthes scabra]